MKRVIGLTLVGYLFVIFSSIIVSHFIVSDEKSRHVVLQIPIALQGALLDALGLGPILDSLTWIGAYLIFAGGTAAVLFILYRKIH